MRKNIYLALIISTLVFVACDNRPRTRHKVKKVVDTLVVYPEIVDPEPEPVKQKQTTQKRQDTPSNKEMSIAYKHGERDGAIAGNQDGASGDGYGYSYDSSNFYSGQLSTSYEQGYEQGYAAGYYDAVEEDIVYESAFEEGVDY